MFELFQHNMFAKHRSMVINGTEKETSDDFSIKSWMLIGNII